MPRLSPAQLPPLSQGNALQRAYARWAEPHYQKLEPGLRERLELVDRWLYSRNGLGFWIGVAGALVGSTIGLRAAGLPWWLAFVAGLLLCLWLPLVALSVWWMPGYFTGQKARRVAGRVVPLATLGGLVGFAAGHIGRHGWDAWDLLWTRLLNALSVLAPGLLLLSAALVGLIWGGARVRESVMQRQLEQLCLQQERDAARSQAMQAQLKLLQGQIQPHFIFNTLSAVQHWVDEGDARAGPLLRALTTFLRGSTELLTRDRVTVGEEAALVQHYLTVMASRLGDRLAWQVQIDAAATGQPLPPGLLLTLVENAVEHGISACLRGGTLRLSAGCEGAQCVIRVIDSAGRWSEQASPSDGVGLRNCRERLRHQFGEAATLHLGLVEGATQAELRLPLDVSGTAA